MDSKSEFPAAGSGLYTGPHERDFRKNEEVGKPSLEQQIISLRNENLGLHQQIAELTGTVDLINKNVGAMGKSVGLMTENMITAVQRIDALESKKPENAGEWEEVPGRLAEHSTEVATKVVDKEDEETREEELDRRGQKEPKADDKKILSKLLNNSDETLARTRVDMLFQTIPVENKVNEALGNGFYHWTDKAKRVGNQASYLKNEKQNATFIVRRSLFGDKVASTKLTGIYLIDGHEVTVSIDQEGQDPTNLSREVHIDGNSVAYQDPDYIEKGNSPDAYVGVMLVDFQKAAFDKEETEKMVKEIRESKLTSAGSKTEWVRPQK